MNLIRFCMALCLATWVVEFAQSQDRRGPFTQAPRSVRGREVDQLHVRLDLKIDLDAETIVGTATHTLKPFKELQEIRFDAADMRIDKVILADLVLKHERKGNQLIIHLDKAYPAGEELGVAIDYNIAQPRFGAHFVTPDESEPNQSKMVWTQSEPEYAQYWFPCVDSPSDRITSEIVATVPANYFVLSNGELTSKEMNPDGTQVWHWVQRKSHVPYLMSVVAGIFESYEQSWQGIPIVSYVPQGRLADAERSFVKTAAMMQFYSERFGYKYPWPKYAQICVDEYNWGGMEHTSATTLNLQTLHDARAHLDVSSVNLVAHELVHQWFGDLMTCKDWGELWLNESFATYFANVWRAHDLGPEEAAWARYREAQRYKGEDKQYRRSIVNYQYNAPHHMFDNHSYPKGARVLHMLRFVLGEEGFWAAIRRYTEINQFRTVETADFRIAIEDATGQGINWFFDQWLYHGGHPEYEVNWRWDQATKSVVLSVRQTQTVDETTPLFKMPIEIEIGTSSGSDMRRIEVSRAEETFHFQLANRPTRVCFDPRDWILKDLTFKKSKEELIHQLQASPFTMSRIRAIQELEESIKEKDVVSALCAGLSGDAFWAVRQQAAKSLGKASSDAARASLITAALKDEKSFVRRDAIKSLRSFKHDKTRDALHEVIQTDKSYYAIAEALRSIIAVDPENCEAQLLAALDTKSHRNVVLKAACDGLVERQCKDAVPRLEKELEDNLTPGRRMAVISGLARLRPDNAASIDLLYQQLTNDRSHVRKAAVTAIVKIGDPAGIDALLSRRSQEPSLFLVEDIDKAVEDLRAKERDLEKLQKETESLRKQNQRLEERLKKLENAAKKTS